MFAVSSPELIVLPVLVIGNAAGARPADKAEGLSIASRIGLFRLDLSCYAAHGVGGLSGGRAACMQGCGNS